MSIYEEFGVTPIINASGTVTRLGGALMSEAVVAAMSAAARESVPIETLQARASQIIAEVTGTQAGLVTNGAAAALTLGAAAILARDHLGRMERLPDTGQHPCEFIVSRDQRNGYDHAVRAAGARLVDVGYNEIVSGAGVRRTEVWEYEELISPRTAGILYVFSAGAQPSLRDVVDMAHAHRIPVLVDAAGELPPRAHLTEIPATGADLVCFSGGKALGGPQGTGILCGQQSLIRSAALQMLDQDDHWSLWSPPAHFIDRTRLPGLPRHGIGRSMKVSKEEIVGLLTALRLFVSRDPAEQAALCRRRLHRIREGLADCPCECRWDEPEHPEECARLDILLRGGRASGAAFEVAGRLRQGHPPVYVGHGRLQENTLVINATALRDDQVDAMISQLRACLR